jgi:hypothetical protein
MKKIICVLGLLLVGCEDPINVALPAVENKLVIDAMLWRNLGQTPGTLEVIISRTADYYDEEVPYVSNATVTLQQFDMIFTAQEDAPGHYYIYNVDVGENDTFTLSLTCRYSHVYCHRITSAVNASRQRDTRRKHPYYRRSS